MRRSDDRSFVVKRWCVLFASLWRSGKIPCSYDMILVSRLTATSHTVAGFSASYPSSAQEQVPDGRVMPRASVDHRCRLGLDLTTIDLRCEACCHQRSLRGYSHLLASLFCPQ